MDAPRSANRRDDGDGKNPLGDFWAQQNTAGSLYPCGSPGTYRTRTEQIAIYIPSPYTNEWEKMFLKFFPDADAAKRFAAGNPSGDFSPATIQERLLKSKSIEQAFLAFLPDPSAQ